MKKTLFLIFLLSFTGCVSARHSENDTSTKLVNSKPYWYWKPNSSGNAGGVGVAGRHVSGKNAQRKLAVQRAIDDIARQAGVKVSSIIQSTASVKGGGSANTSMATFSIQTVDGKHIKAAIQEIWEDPETDELYVWMVKQ